MPDRFRVVFDMVDEIDDGLLDQLHRAYAKGAAAPLSAAVKAFHAVLAEDVFAAELSRRRESRPAFTVALTLAMIPDLTDAETRVIRHTALGLRDFHVRSAPAVSAFFGALVAVLDRRHQPSDDDRHDARLN